VMKKIYISMTPILPKENKMSFQIGNVKCKNNIVVAPMAGVTTPAFRKICLDMGVGLIESEMVSDKALLYGNDKTISMIHIDEDEHPVSMQIFGSDVSTILAAAKLVEKNCTADIIDVNMGCPVNKVIKNGSGSALLRTPEKIYDIVRALKDNISKPITVKIRAGWDTSEINCDKVARLVSLAKADAITIHGRTRSQMYNGQVNLDYIRMVKENSTIPVIGNGDIKDILSLEKMKQETMVDAFMVGRATLGNPWILKKLVCYVENKPIPADPSIREILDTLSRHGHLLYQVKGEHIAMVEMRSHGVWYLKQIPGTKIYRQAMIQVKTIEEFNHLIEVIRKEFVK
jgi:nifR3 family TIM-barrel protein